ncbi:hypothetical protein P1P68_17080, partial [Streptomyces scabiei]|uniref:hypothetical protein n=1 Tax=Streptomyces scabiei TaxID=1930 RepID=UPI0029906832
DGAAADGAAAARDDRCEDVSGVMAFSVGGARGANPSGGWLEPPPSTDRGHPRRVTGEPEEREPAG